MIPAVIATILFAASVLAANRSTRILGSRPANFWRIVVAALLLGGWGHLTGMGLGGGAFGIFFLSGVIGFGLGDYALFEALSRLGPRVTSLMVNCLAAPFAASIEWVWLDTRLTGPQVACGLLVLAGVGVSLAPEERTPAAAPGHRFSGILFGILAGFGQGLGAVLTRKAFAVAREAGFEVDGGTAAYQRILGGLAFVAIPYGWWLMEQRWRTPSGPRRVRTPAERRRACGWVVANALAGPAVGVAFYQWALRVAPSGIVLPVTAMAPLVVVPFTYVFEGDRPGRRSLAGGVLAVAGVIGLAMLR